MLSVLEEFSIQQLFEAELRSADSTYAEDSNSKWRAGNFLNGYATSVPWVYLYVKKRVISSIALSRVLRQAKDRREHAKFHP